MKRAGLKEQAMHPLTQICIIKHWCARSAMHRIAFHLCTYLCKWEYYLKVSTATPRSAMPMEHRATRWLLTVLVQFFLPRYAFPGLPCSPLPVAPAPQNPETSPPDPCLSWFLSLLSFLFPPLSLPLSLSLSTLSFLSYSSIFLRAASKISPRDCQRVDFLFSRTACVYHACNVISWFWNFVVDAGWGNLWSLETEDGVQHSGSKYIYIFAHIVILWDTSKGKR